MVTACVEPRPLYRPRDPQASDLWRLLDEQFDSFRQVDDECYQEKYGFWRPIVEQSVAAFLKCGDLQEGFARVRCPDCKHEMFVAFSCKQRCTCPSCHQKRTLLTSLHVAEDVCSPVAHRQVVLTIPKRLRVAWQDAVFELYLAEEKIDPEGDGMQAGVPRNFQILEPLDFLAEFSQHIPPKGAHLIRYYGWYSNKYLSRNKSAFS